MQNASIAVVDDFHWRINPARRHKMNLFAVGLPCGDFNRLLGLQFVVQTNIKSFGTVEL